MKVNICGIDTANIPKLSAKEQDALMERIKNGDSEAREYFLYVNIRLVLSILKRFNCRNQDIDDLFQVGYLGMVKAINNFDFSLNVRFSTYAVPMIIGEIKRFMRDANSIKVSRSVRDIAYKALKKREEIGYNTGIEPTLLEVSNELDIPISEVACALDAVSDVISYYEPAYNDGEDEILMLEQLADKKDTDAKWTENLTLYSALDRLPDKEREVIDLRFYKGMTQKEIADFVGISQAQVSRLEKIAIDRMKKYII